MPDDKPDTSTQGQQGGTQPPPKDTSWAKTEQVRKERGVDAETRGRGK